MVFKKKASRAGAPASRQTVTRPPNARPEESKSDPYRDEGGEA